MVNVIAPKSPYRDVPMVLEDQQAIASELVTQANFIQKHNTGVAGVGKLVENCTKPRISRYFSSVPRLDQFHRSFQEIGHLFP